MTDHTMPDPDPAEVIIGLRDDAKAEAAMWQFCPRYAGLSCRFSGNECTPSMKREPCPFDDYDAGQEVQHLAPDAADSVPCPTCGGERVVYPDDDRCLRCPTCHGTGVRP